MAARAHPQRDVHEPGRALNARLAELVRGLNDRLMRTYKASRRELFDRLDRPALAPLPTEPFEVSAWKKVALNIDYHVAYDGYLYSAPHALAKGPRTGNSVGKDAPLIGILDANGQIEGRIDRLGRSQSLRMESMRQSPAPMTPARFLFATSVLLVILEACGSAPLRHQYPDCPKGTSCRYAPDCQDSGKGGGEKCGEDSICCAAG